MGIISEPVFEVHGDSDRVACNLGVLAQFLSHKLPVKVSPDSQTNPDPDGFHPGQIGISGKPEQQPAAHVRGLGT